MGAEGRGRRRGRGEVKKSAAPARVADYRRVSNTLPKATVFSDDEIQSIHQTALRVLEELGIRVLLPAGREAFRKAGCSVDEDTMMVRIDRGLVERAIETAPSSFDIVPRNPDRTITYGDGHVIFAPGSGCPNIADAERGRRPGTHADFIETCKLHQSFDVIHQLGPSIEPQDVDLNLRHYAQMHGQLTLNDKVPWVYARGTAQCTEAFRMIGIVQGLSDAEFRAAPRCVTVINTNSPRQLDVPMTQGIMDFAAWGQPSIITPFCLSGAMAPITIPGALTLSHAEALAGVTLAQIVNPGAPVVYGMFSSNVDMKSGAPAFGTPEHIKTNFGGGQLARLIDIPWRSAAGTASNTADVQADYETANSLWACMLGGANLILHAAGWLEGGLTFGYEKFVADVEILQALSETMLAVPCGEDDIGFDAIAEVEPGGHFFAAEHTMARYSTQFYEPFLSDWSNFGQWTEKGARTATERATGVWKRLLDEYEAPPLDPARLEELDAYITERTAAGGASPVD
jgi:trimethylamine--corrinoid protein Co-methyltransferase